ncbi:major facilitator superfamily domain-containing protein [Dipodascopsis tothii]|uniref:major facilitator superfamily domain-containing protein n=1 Tax=Dipodascopsis tothii TaxID=44089 RepID=UPI0034CF3D68
MSSQSGIYLEEQRALEKPKSRPWWKFFDEYEHRDEKKGRIFVRWFDKSDTPAERRLLFKLDILITVFSLVCYWVKSLDQNNINNAYVSGMEEELQLEGNSLVHLQIMYNVGCTAFQLPFMYLFPIVRMELFIPGMDILWGFFTLAQYKAQNKAQMMALRFLIGCAEATFFPGVHYVLGSWFKADEIGRRGGIFYIGVYLGSLTAGLLQSTIYEHLNGVHGLSGWRWMFIIDAAITIPIGVIGFFLWPGTPEKCHSLFLTAEEIQLAKKRMQRNGTKLNHKKSSFDKAMFKRIFTSWHVYVLTFWDVLFWNSGGSGTAGAFVIWLKSLDMYSIPKINNFSAIPPALGIFYLFIICGGSDIFRSRWFFLCLSQSLNFLGQIILAVWEVPFGAKWFAYCLQYFSSAMSSVLYGWTNDILRHDPFYRSIILIIMNACAQGSQVFIPLLVWPTVDKPRYHKGYIYGSTISSLLVVWTIVVLWFYKRDEKIHALNRKLTEDDSSDADDIIKEELTEKEKN